MGIQTYKKGGVVVVLQSILHTTRKLIYVLSSTLTQLRTHPSFFFSSNFTSENSQVIPNTYLKVFCGGLGLMHMAIRTTYSA